MTRVIIADDHQVVREGIARLFAERPEFEVVGEAGDGEEAVALVAEKQPDVVLMDIQMPRLSGIDAIRRIVKSGSGAKILVLSAHESRANVEQALRAGASGYLVKTGSFAEVLVAVAAVMQGASYLSPAVTRQVVDAIARPGDSVAPGIAMLTDREREVLELVVEQGNCADARGVSQDDRFAPLEPDGQARYTQGFRAGALCNPDGPR